MTSTLPATAPNRYAFALVALLAVFAVPQAAADGVGVVLADPPTVGRALDDGNPDAVAPRDLRVGLQVRYRDGSLWNPLTRKSDPVRLRS
ncbi:MAG: hypothetical protein AAFY28_18485, partial [Actinomycetota bacterium]